ncbi:uncharacterized protein BKA55DRAFT_317867 [Fusarium redolens]|uniref:Uncharacterized protein n=1 Tax=Fusarium redolens TaxID=48865 RepID=A0A9P9HEJ5_FUSRE|nr:uncharacterized protein BKA55DRAFT_317867 [Fusarium redolens]KAH7255488.1 hypothetical protein BKA55DRAFT_317867 [Fusarium redolens]
MIGLDPLRPLSNRLVDGVYGGYGIIMEECAAAFSLRASASTITKFAGSHAVSGIGRRRNGYRRGNLEGARTHVESNGDFDFAVVLNIRNFAFDKEFEDLTEKHIRPLLDDMIPAYFHTKNKKWVIDRG